ncbi:MAG: hypothetical protein CM1200mP14_20360 [Gammaproteobacteria bacterium]|nr:MAG: hypothetical protein CM1200mP14_20360 [Gammaproteobacteria bacterium]
MMMITPPIVGVPALTNVIQGLPLERFDRFSTLEVLDNDRTKHEGNDSAVTTAPAARNVIYGIH